MKFTRYSFCFLFVIQINICWAQVIPLPGTHSHNDYNQDKPLLNALSHGFTSIEVDVLLVGNELYVGHELPEGTHSLLTLAEAYLSPLDSIIEQNGGELYPGYDRACYLMIDIKTAAEDTYMLLDKQLRPYTSWIKQFGDGKTQKGSIIIFLSGNRPMEAVLNNPNRLTSLDGRPEDLGKGYSTQVMPVISQAYYRYSQWNGEGEIPHIDKEKIVALAEKVHKENKMLRLWAIPDVKQAWATLQNLGVDIINTDDLEGLKDFLLEE